jgi:hypothetical protein
VGTLCECKTENREKLVQNEKEYDGKISSSIRWILLVSVEAMQGTKMAKKKGWRIFKSFKTYQL